MDYLRGPVVLNRRSRRVSPSGCHAPRTTPVPEARHLFSRFLLLIVVTSLIFLLPHVAFAAAPSTTQPSEADLLLKAATTEGADRTGALQSLAHTGDTALEKVFNDFTEESLYIWQNKVVSAPDTQTVNGTKVAPLLDPLTRQPILVDGKPAIIPIKELKEVSPSRRDRMLVRDLVTTLRLSDKDPEARLAATIHAGEQSMQSALAPLQELQQTESNKTIKTAMQESIALIQLGNTSTDAAAESTRITAAKILGDMRSARALSRLQDLRKTEKSPPSLAALDTAIAQIQHWQTVVEWCGNIFSGLSASSILILMALGLSIIFGLMGVINMAHGELMMIGAYATFLTQQAFVKCLPESAFNYYFIVAIPVAFVAAALVGVLLEATVIRFLYGRPLETLLATWGVSLILIQIVRVEFGDNIAVNSPTWLRGSYEIMQDLNLPYNRLFIIAFCLACIGLMYFIVEKTKLGLLLRATTQNRTMAASLGVSTRKIDMLTFGLGAGLAGLAGCALTQIGGVTPDMGSNYVIDSFLVVVTGGVGKLAGAIWTGLGLGMINKFMEPFFGTVWAKVIILVLVVAFIQRKPSGLFPAKGRMADV
jgi:urea transport system permease protein